MREEIVSFDQKGLGYEAALMRNQRSASAASPFFSVFCPQAERARHAARPRTIFRYTRHLRFRAILASLYAGRMTVRRQFSEGFATST